MKWTFRLAVGILAMVIHLTSVAICSEATADEQVRGRIAQVKKTFQSLKSPPEDRAAVIARLKNVEAALAAGHIYLSLQILEPIWAGVMSKNFATSRAIIEKQGLRAFHREWTRCGTDLKAKEDLLDKDLIARLPTAVRGLIQIDRTTSRTYYEVSNTSGENFGLGAGLRYMGLADAQLDFALFCQRLNLPSPSPKVGLRSLQTEIEQLESRVVESYTRHDTPELVEDNIALSSNLELAGQLNKLGRFEGALIAYMDTMLKLGLLDLPAVPSDQAASLELRLDKLSARLREGDLDNSVGLLYWSMAKTALADSRAEAVSAAAAGGAASSAGSEQEAAAAGSAEQTLKLRRAAVLVDHVLPAYFSYIVEQRK
jgi:hypothetical protein